MSGEKNVAVSGELLEQITKAAQVQGKTPDEVAEDALRKYLGHVRLDGLSSYGQAQARRLGINESDIPRLISEIRATLKSDR
ncbi:MAG: hypothetical protein HYZ37_12290 [Candidatus Solibacter usitatus]|nr:hypothetical protein [Candidatus Solibacter usitatus]